MKYLLNDIREKRGLKTGIIIPLLIMFEASINSCTHAQKKIVVGTTVSRYVKDANVAWAGTILSIIGNMEQDLDTARAGKSEVNVHYPGATSNNPNYSSYSAPTYDYRNNYGIDSRHILDLEKLILKKAEEGIIPTSSEYEFNRETEKVLKGLEEKGYIRLHSTQSEEDFRITHIKHHPILKNVYGSFLYNEGIDFNNDGEISIILDESRNYSLMEIKGLDKKVFDISKERLIIGFNVPDRNTYELVTWRSFTKDGEFIGESTKRVGKGRIQSWYIGPKGDVSDPKDFIDKVKDDFQQSYADWASENKGEFRKAYKIIATIKNNPIPFIEEFEIIK